MINPLALLHCLTCGLLIRELRVYTLALLEELEVLEHRLGFGVQGLMGDFILGLCCVLYPCHIPSILLHGRIIVILDEDVV